MLDVRNPPRGERRMSRKASAIFVANLKGYVGRGRRSASDIARILGCSQRTARRLVRAKPEDIPSLRKVYALRAAAFLKMPVASLCGSHEEPKTSNRLRLWKPSDDTTTARKMAGVFAMQLSARVTILHGLLVDYEVRNGVDARPYEVVMHITDRSKRRHQLKFRDDAQDGLFRLRYVRPDGVKDTSRTMSEEAIEKILKCIRYGKDICP